MNAHAVFGRACFVAVSGFDKRLFHWPCAQPADDKVTLHSTAAARAAATVAARYASASPSTGSGDAATSAAETTAASAASTSATASTHAAASHASPAAHRYRDGARPGRIGEHLGDFLLAPLQEVLGDPEVRGESNGRHESE